MCHSWQLTISCGAELKLTTLLRRGKEKLSLQVIFLMEIPYGYLRMMKLGMCLRNGSCIWLVICRITRLKDMRNLYGQLWSELNVLSDTKNIHGLMRYK